MKTLPFLTLIYTLLLPSLDAKASNDCDITADNIEERLIEFEHSSELSKKCLDDEHYVASLVSQLAFEYEQPKAAAAFFSLSQPSENKRTILPSILISTFHKDIMLRRSTGHFKQPKSCDLVKQRLALFQLVSKRLNIPKTTVWEDFNLIQAYYSQLLGKHEEARSFVDKIFEQVSVPELPDFKLLSDIGYELTDYQLSFYLKFFDERRSLERLSKDESNKALYEAVLKERAMYKQQLKAAAKPSKELHCNK